MRQHRSGLQTGPEEPVPNSPNHSPKSNAAANRLANSLSALKDRIKEHQSPSLSLIFRKKNLH